MADQWVMAYFDDTDFLNLFFAFSTIKSIFTLALLPDSRHDHQPNYLSPIICY